MRDFPSHLISSSLLISSPDFLLREGRRLYTGKGKRRGGSGGGRFELKYKSDRNVSRLSQGMKLPVLGFKTESQYFYLQRYRFNKEISIAVKRYWKMVSEWPNCLGHTQIGIVSFLNSNFTTSFPLCFTRDSSRGLGPVGKYLSRHDTNTVSSIVFISFGRST